MIENFSEQFPILNQFTFLDHASMSPLPKRSADEGKRFLDQVSNRAHYDFKEWFVIRNQVKEFLSTLLHCKPDEIALTKNTSEGLLLVANNLDWQKGDNLIVFVNEFPANIYPWVNLQDKGVEIRFVHETDGKFLIEDILDKIDEKTKLLAISFVEFSSGFKNDLKSIGQLCKDNNIIFVVDAIQGLGAIPINVKECQIDFLSSGGHKWLLSTTGTGCLYLNPDSMDLLKRHNFGYAGAENPFDFFNFDQPPSSSANRFEEGMFNLVGIYIFAESLKFIIEIGVDKIYSRIIDLTSYLIDKVQKLGYTCLTPTELEHRSGIISFYSDSHATTNLFQKLNDHNVIVSNRRDCIRVSPHFYNTNEHIDRLIDCLPEG